MRNGPTDCFIRSSPSASDVRTTSWREPCAQGHETVDDAEVRIDPEPGDELALPVPLVAVQDAAVVDVAVTRGEVRHRQRRLMNREFIQGDDHGRSVRGRTVTRLSATFAGGVRRREG